MLERFLQPDIGIRIGWGSILLAAIGCGAFIASLLLPGSLARESLMLSTIAVATLEISVLLFIGLLLSCYFAFVRGGMLLLADQAQQMFVLNVALSVLFPTADILFRVLPSDSIAAVIVAMCTLVITLALYIGSVLSYYRFGNALRSEASFPDQAAAAFAGRWSRYTSFAIGSVIGLPLAVVASCVTDFGLIRVLRALR